MNGMVSVVVACYNVKKYAEEAVRSVMEQTLRDIEIICVDDGSTDGTAACLDRLAQEDARIHVIHLPKNQGLLAVRHHGVAAANGDYIMFLDGDDRLDKRACEAALAVAEEKQVDVVQFETELFATEDMLENPISEIYRTTKVCTEPLSKAEGALVEACYVDRLFGWNMWAKLFRASCVKKAFQSYGGERLNMGEDILLCFQILCFAKGYAPLCTKYHDYRQASGMTAVQCEFPVEKMQIFAEEYQVYSILNAWLETMHIREKHMRALRFVRVRVYNDVFRTIAYHVPKKNHPRALQILKTYWPAKELAIGFVLIKLFMALNKLFPKGGKARERVKKLASCFIK